MGDLNEVVERNNAEKKEYYVNLSSLTPKRSHKKAAPSRRKSDKSTWKDIDIEQVNELPFDIDGNKRTHTNVSLLQDSMHSAHAGLYFP